MKIQEQLGIKTRDAMQTIEKYKYQLILVINQHRYFFFIKKNNQMKKSLIASKFIEL